jgi:hypothetical protein
MRLVESLLLVCMAIPALQLAHVVPESELIPQTSFPSFFRFNNQRHISGWCGNTTDYCSAAAGCQSAYGTCDNSTTTSNPGTGGTSTNGQCGPGFGTCPSNECCSLAGYCGTTEGLTSYPILDMLTDNSQITVKLPTANSTTDQLATQTRYPLEPTHPQSPELNLDQSSTGQMEFMTVLTPVIWP